MTQKTGKKGKTINFDTVVLEELERKARKEGTTPSRFVNQLVRQAVMKDGDFYRTMAKQYNALFYHYKALADGALE